MSCPNAVQRSETYGNPDIRVEVVSMQGWRPNQEDHHAVYFGPGYTVMAVCDGHGGSDECSRWLAAQMPRIHPMPANELRERLLDMNEEFRGEGGSTLVMAIARREGDCIKVMIAHAGDSRAVVTGDGLVEYETEDHIPDNPVEHARIKAAGGYIYKAGSGRRSYYRTTHGFMLSRAFGNISSRREGIDPSAQEVPALVDITELDLDETTTLWLMCDGLLESGRGTSRFALENDLGRILEDELDMGSTDNMTLMRVEFRDGSDFGGRRRTWMPPVNLALGRLPGVIKAAHEAGVPLRTRHNAVRRAVQLAEPARRDRLRTLLAPGIFDASEAHIRAGLDKMIAEADKMDLDLNLARQQIIQKVGVERAAYLLEDRVRSSVLLMTDLENRRWINVRNSIVLAVVTQDNLEEAVTHQPWVLTMIKPDQSMRLRLIRANGRVIDYIMDATDEERIAAIEMGYTAVRPDSSDEVKWAALHKDPKWDMWGGRLTHDMKLYQVMMNPDISTWEMPLWTVLVEAGTRSRHITDW